MDYGALHLAWSKASSARTDSFSRDTRCIVFGVFGILGAGTARLDSESNERHVLC